MHYTIRRTGIKIKSPNDYRRIETQMIVVHRENPVNDMPRISFKYVVSDGDDKNNQWDLLTKYDIIDDALQVHEGLINSITTAFGIDNIEIKEGWNS